MEGCERTVREHRGGAREVKKEIEIISRCVEKMVGERDKIQWRSNVREMKDEWQR